MRRNLAPLLLLLILCPLAFGQVATGTYPLGTFDNLGADTINVGNLNVILDVPVLHKPGRAGTNFNYDLIYNGSIWTPGTSWTPNQNWGWLGQTATITGFLSEIRIQGFCAGNGSNVETQSASPDFQGPGNPYTALSGVVYYDAIGIMHRWAGRIHSSGGLCAGDTDTLSNTYSVDHRYKIGSGGFPITDLRGNVVSPPIGSIAGAANFTDNNGNEITNDGSGHFTDTTGNVALTIAGGAPSNQTYTYTDSSAASRAVTISYKSYNVATSFGCSGIAEYTGTAVSLVDTITLPDSSAWHFTYEATPGGSGTVTGRLQTVQVPAGGLITYTYSGANNGINCADGSALGLKRALTSAAGSPYRTYARTVSGLNSHTEVIDGMGNYSEYDFVKGQDSSTNPSEVYQTALSVKTGNSGTPLLAQQTCYNGATVPCTTQSLTMPITGVQQYSTWDGVTQDGSALTYDTSGNLTNTVLYDFGSASARGSSLLTDSRPFAGGLLQSETISNAAGTISTTNYTYDSVSLHSTSGVPQHVPVANYGNLTQVSVLTNPGVNANALTTNYSYYDTGSLYSQTSPSGGTTTYAYDSTTNTYAQTVTPPDPHSVGLSSTYTYDSYLGQIASGTSPNGALTSISTSDGSGRSWQVVLSMAGTTQAKITGQSLPTQSKSITYQATSTSSETDTYYDPYGRAIRSSSQSDSGNWYVTDTCYDANGRVHFQSYPYKTATLGSQVCSGLGDTYSYDSLGRTLSVTHGDSPATSINYIYYGNSTKVTDENGIAHIYQTDAASRPTITCELTSTALNGVSPTNCGTAYTGTGFVTSYGYTNRVLTITQGAQTRSFTSDGAGRLTTKQEPEGNWTNYTYSSNSTGNVVARQTPKANQTNTSGSPGTTTTTTTQYDQLNRPVSVTYDDGVTPTKTFTYDAALSGSTFNVGYAKGLITAAATSTGASTQFSYDSVGRVQGTSQCIPGWCGVSTPPAFTRSYGYDWANNPLSEQYGTPSGTASLGYTVNLAGQVLTATGGQDTSLSTLYTATALTPVGPTAASLGNGVTATWSYDPLGRNSGLGLMHGSTALYASTAHWSGRHLTSSSDSVNGTGSYTFDDLNRLKTSAIGSSAGTLNLTWTYDRYGNRLSQSATGSYTGTVSQPTYSVGTTTNRITSTGYQYDAVGNLETDGVDSYTYDAEGNVTGISGGTTATFAYDALNQRVLSTINGTTKAYGFNASGQRATVWSSSGALISAQYYAAGRPLAYWLATDGHVRFQHQDWVGTERFRTTYTGAVDGSFTSLPFGDSQATAGADTDVYHYAELDKDSTELQHAQFRNYSDIQGRWIRPDPYLGSYTLTDPQSFNRYSYVLNNPLIFVDPLGLSCVEGAEEDEDGDLTVYISDDGDGKGCDAAGVAAGGSGWDGDTPSTWQDLNPGTGDTVPSGPDSPGDFSIDMSSDEFIAGLQGAGFFVSYPDTFLGRTGAGHPGTNLRDSNQNCSVHVNIDPGSGMNGQPVTGSWHYDAFNPFTSDNGLVNHFFFDVIPDYAWAHDLSFITAGTDLPPILPIAWECQ